MQTFATTIKTSCIYAAGVIGGTAAVASAGTIATFYFVGSMLPAAITPYVAPLATTVVVRYTEPTSFWARFNPVYLAGSYAASTTTKQVIDSIENRIYGQEPKSSI